MDLEPLDPEYVANRLSCPPFVQISGVVNARDLGSYPTLHSGHITKPKFVFRSGEVSAITTEGVQQIQLPYSTMESSVNNRSVIL